MAVELNPNIIKKVRPILEKNPLSCFGFLSFLNRERKQKILNHVKEFSASFKMAKKYAVKFPIAFRLEPILKKRSQEDISIEKFGGIPNLLLLFHKWHYIDQKSLEKYSAQSNKNKKNEPKIKFNFPSCEEYIEQAWPRCKCCNEPMKFIGQLKFQDWLIAIHQLTYKERNKTIYSKYSGVGSTSDVGKYIDSYQKWYIFWFCDNNHFDEPNSDARCDIAEEYIPMEIMYNDPEVLENLERDYKPIWSKKEYIAAAKAFIKKYKLYTADRRFTISTPISLQQVTGYKLKFDIEYQWHKLKYDSEDYNLAEKIEKKDYKIFSSQGDFQLFGKPRSQQWEPRHMCQNSHIIHRMNPLLNWDDEKNDITNQMYGCMRCPAYGLRNVIFGRMDSSCT